MLKLDNIKGVMFDLDGTLVNSMWVWSKLMTDFMGKRGIEPPDYVLNEVSHMSLRQSSVYMKDIFNFPESPEEIRQIWHDMVYEAYATKVELKDGVKEFLEKLKGGGKKLAIVSSCQQELCEACLKNNDIFDLFDVFTYADDVGVGKKRPDIYIECMKRLDCGVEEVILFEDILVGMRTAQKIGIKVVAVEDESANLDRETIKKEADIYIRDFVDL